MSEPTTVRPAQDAGDNSAPELKAANAESRAPSPQEPAASKAQKRKLARPLLFAALPVALIAGGYVYVTGGQVVSTDNAYVEANIAGISTDVSGTVESIAVHDNERVKEGQILFRLKPSNFQIALDAAKAKLASTRNDLEGMQASYRQTQAQIVKDQSDLPFYRQNFDRQKKLVSTATSSRAALDQARHDLESAWQQVEVDKAEAAAALAKLGGDADQPITKNPLYLQAQAAVDDAQRQLDHTIVKAPFDGVVTKVNSLQVGDYLPAAQTAFSLVSTKDLWISANPKETELTYVRAGQSVTITVDAYPGVEWKGKVASISPASESSFSLLPAQNSSGNWVKVVQRIPMRVSIEDTAGKPPLRAGMSTNIDINTGHTRGLPQFVRNLIGETTAYAHE